MVMLYLLWCIVMVVGAESRRINLPQLYSYNGGDLHDDISELMATSFGNQNIARVFKRCIHGINLAPIPYDFYYVCKSAPLNICSIDGKKNLYNVHFWLNFSLFLIFIFFSTHRLLIPTRLSRPAPPLPSFYRHDARTLSSVMQDCQGTTSTKVAGIRKLVP
jgi:hypothetical protein